LLVNAATKGEALSALPPGPRGRSCHDGLDERQRLGAELLALP